LRAYDHPNLKKSSYRNKFYEFVVSNSPEFIHDDDQPNDSVTESVFNAATNTQSLPNGNCIGLNPLWAPQAQTAGSGDKKYPNA